jgi:hypothetical protein
MQVTYKGVVIGDVAFAHIVVEGKIMVFPVAIGDVNALHLDSLKDWIRHKPPYLSRSRTPRLADAPGGFVRYTGAGLDGLGWNLFDAQSVKNMESGRLPPTTREETDARETMSLGIDAHFEHVERGRLYAVHA